MPGTVSTKNLTTITAAEAADSANWVDASGGAGSGQDTGEAPLQGAPACRSRRAGSVTNSGFAFDNTTDISVIPRGRHVGVWFSAFAPGLITKWQLLFGEGSTFTGTPWWAYSFFTTNYPRKSGWLRKWIDPTLLAATESAGTVTYLFRLFGLRYSTSGSAGSSDNMRQDATHYTTGTRGGGLLVNGGTVPSPATFQDFIDADEGTVGNRYGVVESSEGALICYGELWIGDSTATIFNDVGSLVLFADHNTGGNDTVRDDFMSVVIDLQNATTDVDIAQAVFKSGGTPLGSIYVLSDAAAGTLLFDGCTFSTLRALYLHHDCTVLDSVLDSCGLIQVDTGDTGGDVEFNGSNQYLDTTTNVAIGDGTGRDFEIIACVAADDWTPSLGSDYICAHGNNSATTVRFQFGLTTGGAIELIVGDGTALSTHTSTALSTRIQTGSAGEYLWVRAVYDYDGGGGGNARVSFYYSEQGPDTPWQDVTWTALGTSDQTQRAMASTSTPFTIGSVNHAVPAGHWDGHIKFVTMCVDGFFNTGTSADGDTQFRFDFRTGPDFSGSPLVRGDSWNSALTWEAFNTPTRTLGGDESTGADLSNNTISNATGTAALYWNVDENPTTKLDGISFVSSGTGHAIELGPNCPSTINLNSQSYSGYAGSSGDTGNEVIYNNSGKAVTLNIGSNGAVPTVRSGTGASTTIVNAKTMEITGLTEGAQGAMIADAGGPLSEGTIIFNEAADANGRAGIDDFNFTAVQPVIIRARSAGVVAACIINDVDSLETDVTTEARDRATTSDVPFLPSSAANGDYFAIGGLTKFSRVLTDLASAGSGFTENWEYWNGSSWQALSNLSGSLGATGERVISYDVPGDWATKSESGRSGTFYYIRMRASGVFSPLRPIGHYVTINVRKYKPFDATGQADNNGLSVRAVWIEDDINEHFPS